MLILSFGHNITVPQADLSTLEYNGGIQGYNDGQEHSSLYFKVNTLADAYEVINIVKYQLYSGYNPESEWVQNCVSIKDQFEDYVKDKRPSVVIQLMSGYKGLRNPFFFRLINK